MILYYGQRRSRYGRGRRATPLEMMIVGGIFFALIIGMLLDGAQRNKEREQEKSYRERAYSASRSARDEEAPANVAKVGGTYKFGRYKQVSDLVDEPIVWRVLDMKDKTALVCSEVGLDRVLYNATPPFDRKWESSSIRKWLNGDFLKTAFYNYERDLIRDTVVKNSVGKDTTDKVFLLSAGEFAKYFGGRSPSAPSRYSVQRGTKEAASGRGKGNCWVWLRDSGATPGCFAFVEPTGEANLDGRKGYDDDGSVRPAMWVEIE